jgi:hypothetical protein
VTELNENITEKTNQMIEEVFNAVNEIDASSAKFAYQRYY